MNARDEWDRVAPGLFLFGLLSEVDVMSLGAYCEAYKRWRTARLRAGTSGALGVERGVLVRDRKLRLEQALVGTHAHRAHGSRRAQDRSTGDRAAPAETHVGQLDPGQLSPARNRSV